MAASTPAKKKRKEAEIQKVDQLIEKMTHSLEQTENDLKARRESENDFYRMIGKRAAKLSPECQQWMEDEVWDILRAAQKKDSLASKSSTQSSTSSSQASTSTQPSTSIATAPSSIPRNREDRNLFSFIHNSIPFNQNVPN